jgi:hypothetical protein
MTLAVHAHPALTMPVALALMVPLCWYWMRLGREDVPASRRRIRRGSLILMAAILVLLVMGLSFVDDVQHQRGYVLTWTGAIVAVMLMIPVATIDAVNNMSLYRKHRSRMLTESTREILDAARADASESGER